MNSRNTAVGGSSEALSRKGSKEMEDTTPNGNNDHSDDSNSKGDANSKPAANQFLAKYPVIAQWKSRRAFMTAQYQVFAILGVAYIINKWPISYPREDNHNEYLFWALVAAMGGVAYYTRKHEPSSRGVQLLSRDQTEEWKGWMQFVFIMVRSEIELLFLFLSRCSL